MYALSIQINKKDEEILLSGWNTLKQNVMSVAYSNSPPQTEESASTYLHKIKRWSKQEMKKHRNSIQTKYFTPYNKAPNHYTTHHPQIKDTYVLFTFASFFS